MNPLKKLLGIFCLSVTVTAYAAHITPDEAISRAMNSEALFGGGGKPS